MTMRNNGIKKKPVENPVYNVTRLRRRLGLLQRELAKVLMTTEREISRWEREGIVPSRRFMRKIKELEKLKFGDHPPERPFAVHLRPLRKVPPPVSKQLGTARPMRFGVLPSSY